MMLRAAKRKPVCQPDDAPLPKGWSYVGYKAADPFDPSGVRVILTELLNDKGDVVMYLDKLPQERRENIMPIQHRERSETEKARAAEILADEAARKRELRSRKKKEREQNACA